jgi:cell division protein FtsI/penicillin-binding protein 2
MSGAAKDPALRRVRLVSLCVTAAFALLAMRTAQLSLSGPGEAAAAPTARAAVAAPGMRADLTDRNGVLLAASIPSYVLIARPRNPWPGFCRALIAQKRREGWAIKRGSKSFCVTI